MEINKGSDGGSKTQKSRNKGFPLSTDIPETAQIVSQTTAEIYRGLQSAYDRGEGENTASLLMKIGTLIQSIAVDAIKRNER